MDGLTDILKREARRLGFDLVGACPAVAPPSFERFRRWLDEGMAGRMRYLDDRAEAYAHPRHVLDGARSILMLGLGYRATEPVACGPGQGRVARYAWGEDYHELIHRKLRELAEVHRRHAPEGRVRGVVDTAPLLEREFGRLAGLGWIGKNTMLLNKHLGSWFFLAALLSSEVFEYDAPMTGDYCGSCRACLDACPTGALVEPYRLDARKCLGYLTIELRDAIPPEFRTAQGTRLFGCDACQEACPWNRRVPTSAEEAFEPAVDRNPVDLAELFFLDEDAFRRRFRGTAFWRTKRRGLLRNAAIVLGNRPTALAVPALVQGLGDPAPTVRGACAWALGRHDNAECKEMLRRRLAVEEDAAVRREIEAALEGGAAEK